MRYLVIIIFILTTGLNQSLIAQIQNDDDSLKIFVDHKFNISLRGTHALLSWSAVNLGTGIYGSVSTDGRIHYFHQMNAFWGGINLIISAAGYANLRRTKNQPIFLHRAELDQKKTEHAFMFNMGLDALYIGGGAALIEFAKSDDLNQDRIEGYGYSIIMQGAFLLTFDSVLYLIHRNNRKRRLDPLLYKISFTGYGFIYRFG